jgi:hypothetical protein
MCLCQKCRREAGEAENVPDLALDDGFKEEAVGIWTVGGSEDPSVLQRERLPDCICIHSFAGFTGWPAESSPERCCCSVWLIPLWEEHPFVMVVAWRHPGPWLLPVH